MNRGQIIKSVKRIRKEMSSEVLSFNEEVKQTKPSSEKVAKIDTHLRKMNDFQNRLDRLYRRLEGVV